MKEQIRKIKTYITTHTWLQYSLIWLGLILVSLLGMNNNYHTLSWINRIIPIYSHEGMTIFPGSILIIIAIYNLFRAFHYISGNYLFNKNWKCFICTIIFIGLLSEVNVGAIEKIRGFQSGLDAIYLDRDHPMNIILHDTSTGKEKVYRTEGVSRIKNCSDETVGPFKVTVTLLPSENHPGGSFICERSYGLAPGEEGIIDLSYQGILTDFVESKVYGDNTYVVNEGIQIMLWNEEGQVVFYSE